jgi:hypothetical protein
VILLLRPEDRNVWLLACFFAGIVSASGFPDNFQTAPAPLRLWIELYGGIFLGALGASFYFLCAVFPARSPIDRRLPWLKWAALVLGLANAGEMSRPDVSRPVATLSRLIGPQAADRFDFAVALAFLALGLVSLAANYFFASQPESRRKIRVIFWGTVVGLGPPLIRAGAEQYTSFRSPDWLEMLLNALILLVPASFAYAVFKQRVLDIPVLLQRGARYLLVQRGFLILLCFVSFGLTLLFAASLTHVPLVIGMGHSASTALGAVFGTALLWGGSRVHTQVSGKIDRAFFRNAYDVRVILENLADTSRTATNREALARLLLNQLNAALQPASLVVYLATNNDELGAAAGVAPPELQTIRCTSPLLVKLARQGEPWELPPAGLENDPATAALAPLGAGNGDCQRRSDQTASSDRAGVANARLRGAMSPGSARRRRLLRFSRAGPRPGGAGAGRCLRQRRPRRPVDGQLAGPFAQSQRALARRIRADDAARSRQDPATGEPGCLEVHGRATLRYALFRPLRRLDAPSDLCELRP